MTHKLSNEQVKSDLRVQRTHKLIQEALLDLTVQKGFSNVTVRDITQKARINRATFYRHYQDKFDLLDRYSQEVYELLDTSEAEAGTGVEERSETSPVGLVRMLEHIRTNARFYRVMLGKNGDPAFTQKIQQYIEKRLRRSLPETLLQKGNLIDLYLRYMSNGSVGAVLWWLEHDMPYSPEELAALSFRLSTANLQVLFDV
jgi:AcrR family transcriptional regulator